MSPEDGYYNAVALLQESDMRHLVDALWNRQSCISGSRNMEDLILTRWDPRVELSPWNCILLTKKEAETHERQMNPLDMYSEEFVSKIHQKHLLARNHFSQLPSMERYLRRHYMEEEYTGRLIPKLEA
jgi:IQ and ubiquitin-like domain-containing protein